MIRSFPEEVAQVGSTYVYDVDAEDTDPHAFRFDQAPSGMSVDGAGRITWTPQADQAGYADVNLSVADTHGNVVRQQWRIAVFDDMGGNHPPVIESIPVSMTQTGTPYRYDLSATDADGDTLTYTINFAPFGMSVESNGTVSWTSETGYEPYQEINVSVTDGRDVVWQAWRLAVVPDLSGNRPPVIHSTPLHMAQPGTAYIYEVNATDSEGDTLSYTLDHFPAGMQLDGIDGVVSWEPNASHIGFADINLSVRDVKGARVSQAWRIAVVEDLDANHPPIIHSAPTDAAQIDTRYRYDINATDSDGDALTYALHDAPAGMSVESNGTVYWTPGIADIGYRDINVTVSDPQGAQTAQQWRIAVVEDLDANHPPIIRSTPTDAAQIDTRYRYDINATDSDGDALTYALHDAPAGMSVESNGTVYWTPGIADIGYRDVNITVTDVHGATARQQWRIAVVEDLSGNHPPLIHSTPPYLAQVGFTYFYEINAIDPDNDGLTYAPLSTPQGMVVDEATGVVTWTPRADQSGMHDVAITVTDAMGASVNQTWNITVTPEHNQAPTITSAPTSKVDADELYTYTVIASDPDPDGHTLTYTLDEAPEGMHTLGGR